MDGWVTPSPTDSDLHALRTLLGIQAGEPPSNLGC